MLCKQTVSEHKTNNGQLIPSGLSITAAPTFLPSFIIFYHEQNGHYNSNKNIYSCIHSISPWYRIPTLDTFSKWVVLRLLMLFSPFPLERYHLSRNALWSIFRGSSYFARYFQWRSQVPQFVRFVQVSTIFVFFFWRSGKYSLVHLVPETSARYCICLHLRRHQRDTVFVSIAFHINVSFRKCS